MQHNNHPLSSSKLREIRERQQQKLTECSRQAEEKRKEKERQKLLQLVEDFNKEQTLIQQEQLLREKYQKKIENVSEIRKQQELEFAASLKADQEKEEMKLLEEQLKQTLEISRTEFLENLIQQRKRSIELLGDEPSESNETCTVVMKLPDGNKIKRVFSYSTPIDHLFLFAEGHLPLDIQEFNLVQHFPRKTITKKTKGILKELIKENEHQLFLYIEPV